MKRYNYLHIALLLITLSYLQTLVPPTTAACAGTSSAVVSALLPLHTGANCSALQLRGLQQLAALRAAIKEVNNDMKAQDGLSIGLQVQDTCSSPDGAMKAALRSLVEVQQTCSNPPLFLGIIGPEDAESLARVKGVTRVFNATHVLPTFHAVTKESEEATVFYASIERYKEQVQSVITLLRQLRWQSFSIAFEEPMAEMAEGLLRATKEDSSLCVKGSVSRLSPQASVPNIFAGRQDGVVVLTDSHQMAARVLQAYQALTTPMILLVRTVGLEAWQVPRSASKMYLLQQVSTATEKVPETMNATLKAEYESQRESEFQNVHCKDITNAADCAIESSIRDNLLENIDVSVTSMANSVRLIASALKTVHRTRCMSGVVPNFGMCAKLLALPAVEWRTVLRRATIFSENHRIRFLMELPISFQVYSRDNNAGNLIKVATIASGTLKDIINDYSFPVMHHASSVAVCDKTPVIPIVPPTILHIPPTTTFEEGGFSFKDFLYTSEYSFYELVGMICGVGFIMLAVMVVVIYLIYNNLVVKTDKESTGGSVETARGNTRPKRKNFRDAFRRNSSGKTSNHS